MENETYEYIVSSKDMLEYFNVKDKLDEYDEAYYVLECYSEERLACYYDLYWKIVDEKSDVPEKVSSSKKYKQLCDNFQIISMINTSSPFAMASSNWLDDDE